MATAAWGPCQPMFCGQECGRRGNGDSCGRVQHLECSWQHGPLTLVGAGGVCGAGQTVTVVGECDVSSGRGMEFSKSGMRPPFDSNVVYNFDLLESVSC